MAEAVFEEISCLFEEGEEAAGSISEVSTLAEESEEFTTIADTMAEEGAEAGSGNTAEEIEQGFREGSEAVTESLKEGGSSLAAKAKEFAKYMWNNKASFAKTIGVEVAKGAAFQVGIKAVDAAIKAIWDKDKKPAVSETLQEFRKVSESLKKLEPVRENWNLWLMKNYDNRDQFGEVEIKDEDISISIFQIYQKKIGDLSSNYSAKVVPALKAVKKKADIESVAAFKIAAREQADSYVKIAKEIQGKKEEKMRAARLEDHLKECQAVYDSLK